MKNIFLSIILILSFIQIGHSQTAVIGGNQYAFQWSANPSVGLYFSSANSRYELRDLSGNADWWFNPVENIIYQTADLGIGNPLPSARLDVRNSNSDPNDFAIAGRGKYSPTNGYLGVQGGNPFDNIVDLDLYPGWEIGAVGLSIGGGAATDNIGVLGYSNHYGLIGENRISGFAARFGMQDRAGWFNGKVQLTNGENVSLSEDGYLQIGESTAENTVFGENSIQARDNGAADNLTLQSAGGNLVIGQGSGIVPTERLRIHGIAGQDALRALVDGFTKFHVHANGGSTFGTVKTPPTNGLYVHGDINVGANSPVSGYKLTVDGKIICEELTVQLSTVWPDYVFEPEYQLLKLPELREYIKANKHLPGVPAAAEVEEAGISVGEMQTKMMEKIEELTLYVLELEAANAEMQNRVEQLEKAK